MIGFNPTKVVEIKGNDILFTWSLHFPGGDPQEYDHLLDRAEREGTSVVFTNIS